MHIKGEIHNGLGFKMRTDKNFMFIPDSLKKIEISITAMSVFCPHFLQEPTTLLTSYSKGIEKQHLDLIAVLICRKQRTGINLIIAL